MCEEPKVLPERVMITIDITEAGDITCWTASHLDGRVIEDWRLTGRFTSAAFSHTWEVGAEAYVAIRDILRFLTEDDWEPGTVM
jgi:hypothetical protein